MPNEEQSWKGVAAECRGNKLVLKRPELALIVLANVCAKHPGTLCVGLGARDAGAVIGTEDGLWQASYTSWEKDGHRVDGVSLTLDANGGVRRSFRIPLAACTMDLLELEADADL